MDNRYGTYSSYYTDGNTVRKVSPEYIPIQRRRPERGNIRSVRMKPRVRKRIETSMDVPFLLMLTIAIVATLYICFSYLGLKASIDYHMDNIEHLETRLENLKTENDALEQSIDTSLDLNKVYQIATTELGMIHAGPENVRFYDKTETEYVRQYESIPE